MNACILSDMPRQPCAAGGGCGIKASAIRVPGNLDTLHFSLHELRPAKVPAAAAVT
jgi:hypothetical protein